MRADHEGETWRQSDEGWRFGMGGGNNSRLWDFARGVLSSLNVWRIGGI